MILQSHARQINYFFKLASQPNGGNGLELSISKSMPCGVRASMKQVQFFTQRVGFVVINISLFCCLCYLQISEGISCKQVQFLRKGLFLLFCFHCFRLLDGSRMAGRLASGLSDSTFLEVLERCHIIFIPLIIIIIIIMTIVIKIMIINTSMIFAIHSVITGS